MAAHADCASEVKTRAKENLKSEYTKTGDGLASDNKKGSSVCGLNDMVPNMVFSEPETASNYRNRAVAARRFMLACFRSRINSNCFVQNSVALPSADSQGQSFQCREELHPSGCVE